MGDVFPFILGALAGAVFAIIVSNEIARGDIYAVCLKNNIAIEDCNTGENHE